MKNQEDFGAQTRRFLPDGGGVSLVSKATGVSSRVGWARLFAPTTSTVGNASLMPTLHFPIVLKPGRAGAASCAHHIVTTGIS